MKNGVEIVMESEFLTVKEFAEKAGVSVQSVYQRLNKSLKPYFKVIKGVKYIEIKALTEVYGLKVEQGFKGDFKENIKGFKQDFKGSEERKNNTSEQVIDLLRDQLRKKDEQIAELHDLLKDAQSNLNAAQIGAAIANKRCTELESKLAAIEEDVQEPEVKKWWQFWK